MGTWIVYMATFRATACTKEDPNPKKENENPTKHANEDASQAAIQENTRSTKNPNAILTNVEPNVSNPIFIKN
jgi:hypothetical protein